MMLQEILFTLDLPLKFLLFYLSFGVNFVFSSKIETYASSLKESSLIQFDGFIYI
jgi:hypothetical protein